jgi:molecular chaperone DnaK
MAFAVGIDLGTTNTVVAAVRGGTAGTVPDPQGVRLIPSVVSFHPSGSVLVGRGAVERRLIDPASTVYSVKRLIGRAWTSPEVAQSRGKLPFELREGPQGGTVVAARGETYSLPEISAFVLRQAKAIAEASLGASVDRAVITVPANFNDLQRGATKTAGRLAGLEVLRILNEPTAAALAYGPQGNAQERIAVYDFGGGTFDVTLLDLAGNVFEVLATAGDTALGGDDIDVVVGERMADDLLKKHRFDARAQPQVFARLRILAEEMKQELSWNEEQTIAVDDLVPGERGMNVPWTFRMTRPELEWASLALIERTFRVCQQALDTAGIGPGDLDRVILVGGATRMPMVARKVEQFFRRPPVVRINPDEVVALGAAIQAALLDRGKQKSAEPMAHPRIAEDSVVQELPSDLGPANEDILGLPIIGGPKPPPPKQAQPAPKAAPPPAAPAPKPKPVEPPAASKPEFLPGRSARALVFDVPEPPAPPPRLELAIDPRREPSSLPPAPVAPPAPPPPPRPAPLLIDVTPLSLGVETVGDFCDVLIEANTPVPCDRTRSFTTAAAGQTTVRVRVAQGESKRFGENTFLGEVELSGIPAAGRGEPQIAVTFEIDADGILNVRARDVKTGLQTVARIQLVGAQNDPAALEAMRARQAAHPLAVEGRT